MPFCSFTTLTYGNQHECQDIQDKHKDGSELQNIKKITNYPRKKRTLQQILGLNFICRIDIMATFGEQILKVPSHVAGF